MDLSERIGAAALPSLDRYLADASMGRSRTYIAEAIGRIGESHPESAARCIEILMRQLRIFDKNEPEVNGILIAALIDCDGQEAAPLMEQAFAANKVDESMAGDWPMVQYEMGLTDEQPDWRNPMFRDVAPAPTPKARPQSQPANRQDKRKSQRQAKKKNRKKKR